MDSENKPKTKRRRVTWFGVVFLAICVVFAGSQLYFSWFLGSDAIPAALKAPPADLIGILRPSESTSATLRSAALARWDLPDRPSDYADFVRFQIQKNPGLEGAALYLKLAERFQREAFDFHMRQVLQDRFRDGWDSQAPLSSAQRNWVEAQQGYIDELRRMIAAGGPPVPAPDELLFPVPDYTLLSDGVRLLILQAELRREVGDLAGAAAPFEDAYRLADCTADAFLIGQMIQSSARSTINSALAGWLSAAPPPPAVLAELEETLDDRIEITRRHTVNMASEMLLIRQYGIQSSTSWKQTIAFSMMIVGSGGLATGESSEKAEGFLSPLGMYLKAVAGSVRIKRNAQEDIQAYDAYTVQFLSAAKGPYAGFEAFNERGSPVRKGLFHSAMLEPNYGAAMGQAVTSEARTNIDRAALRLLQNESPPAPPNDRDGDAWLRSPWRDPFTEEPLKIIDETSSTLIYSLGPDLKDQDGAVAYDPSNGTISAGDLALRIPKGRSN